MTSGSWPAVKAFAWAMYGQEDANPVKPEGPGLRQLREYMSVQKEIRDAIAEERVSARGLTAPKSGSNATLQAVDSEEFRIFQNMAVDVLGETVSLSPRKKEEIPRRFEIAFEQHEIKALFPDKDCEIFLDEYLTKNPQTKQSEAITACVAKINKPVRDAKKAWIKVAKKWGRGPGKRIK